MEAIGFVANIAAFIPLTAQITQLSHSYVQHVKKAPNIQKRYLQEVSALMDVLFRIEQTVVDTQSTGLLPPRPALLDDHALIDCYKELSLLRFELQKRTSRLLRPFHDKELRLHIDMIHKFRENLSKYLSACTLVTGNPAYQKVSSISIEQDRNVLLALVPPVEIPLREKPIPCPGTGQWFLNNPIVKCWIERSSPRMLWCHGPPGVGKSFLVSIVVDYLAKQRPGDALVVYFFCDFPSQTEHSAVNILRNIIRQLAQGGNKSMLRALKEFVDEFDPPQNATDITKMIAKAGSVQPIYLVLDALDEMQVPDQLLDHCLNLSTSGIHVLLTSRNLPHIQKKMVSSSQLEIAGSKKDLKIYIEKRLQESDFDDGLAEDDAMVDHIVSKSGNLFLLARLTLDELLDLNTVGQIKMTLKREALGLQNAFELTMQRIDGQSKARSSMARRLISWVLYAKRRLKVEEIMTAFAIDEQDEEGVQCENMPTSDTLIPICRGLVAINQTDSTVGLVHTSAYDYLYTVIMPESSHFDIAQTCLRYLGLNGLISDPCTNAKDLVARFNESKFLHYSAKHWGDHVCNRDSEKALQSLIMVLLNDQKLLNAVFQALQYQPGFDGALADEMFDSIPKGQQALHIVAYWNLIETTKILLDAGAEICIVESHKWTALHWTCSRGHLEVSRMLVQKGANTNLPDIQGWTPLFWAAFIGNVELVRLLLSNGADHQFRNDSGWTALHWAISGGHISVVQELLDHHSSLLKPVPPLYTMKMAQVKAYSQGTISPVAFAADAQDADLFNLLVQHLESREGKLGGAKFNCIWETAQFDVPVSENPWRILTRYEYFNGIESNVPRIRDCFGTNNCEEEARSDSLPWKSFLLVSAIRDDQLSCVQMLAQSGINLQDHFPLHLAAHRKDPRYVQCLLENGADVTLMDGKGRTALHTAILNGFVETMTVLIEGGSDVNQTTLKMKRLRHSIGAPPIILAHDSVRMARILLSNGADPNLCDDNGRTALSHAFSQGNIEIIKLLLEFDAAGIDAETPLHSLTRYDDSNCAMEDLKDIVLSFIASGNSLSPPRDYLHERLDRSDLPNSSEVVTNDLTPLYMSLMKGRWKLLSIFSELGGNFPSNFDLNPSIEKAIQDIEPYAIALLCRKGGLPPPNSVLLLVESLYNLQSRIKHWQSNESMWMKRFKRSLADLCSAGVDINFRGTVEYGATNKDRSRSDMTALAFAATSFRSREITLDLLAHGSSVYAELPQTFDPILTAALYGGGDEDIAILLRHSTLQPDPSHWTRFLNEASEEKDSIRRICFCLRKAGCLEKANAEGQTLLDLAVRHGQTGLMAALKIEGARGQISPVYRAVEVQKQTDAKLRNISPLETALKTGDVATVSRLLQGGSDPNQIIPERGNNIPMLCYAARDCKLKIVGLLLSHNADTELADDYGWRALHVACFKGHIDIVTALISNGADVRSSTRKWNNDREKPSGLYKDNPWTGTPLHIATMRGYSDISKVLLEKNADIHASTGVLTGRHLAYPASGPTALHIALSVNAHYFLYLTRKLPSPGQLRIAHWLVDAGAMVQGVIEQYSLSEILRFAEFPELWDALVAGDTIHGNDGNDEPP